MQIIDFTDKLTATLPDVPLGNLIRFNNSWLFLRKEGKGAVYLVAYRAMAYKDLIKKNPDGTQEFAFPEPPEFPGMQGTPWGAGWAAPIGNAEKEACVPEGRGGCYFDGVGLAEIHMERDEDNPSGLSFKVLDNYILEDTDGYEDPRLFYGDKSANEILLHAHRIHPQPERDVLNFPGPIVSPDIANAIQQGKRCMCVKLVQLHKHRRKYRTGREFFFGLNISQSIEKNFGFFVNEGRMFAVYGVAPYGRPMTLLMGGEIMFSGDRKSASVPVTPYFPSTTTREWKRDCFPELQAYYNRNAGRDYAVRFSSSGPLLKHKERWLGVGHIMVSYRTFYNLFKGVITGYEKLISQGLIPETARHKKYEALLQDRKTLELILNYLASEMSKYSNLDGYAISDSERIVFQSVSVDFLQSPILRLIALLQDKFTEKFTIPAMGRPLDKSNFEKEGVILHPNAFYFSFLYEIEGIKNKFEMARFSDAFICTNPEQPTMLQFATNLARCEGGYLLGVGENDHRASVIHMTEDEVETLLHHTPKTFCVADYKFDILASREGPSESSRNIDGKETK